MSRAPRPWLLPFLLAGLCAALLSACASAPWAGMSETEIAAWKEAGFTAQNAHGWKEKGFTPQQAGEWGRRALIWTHPSSGRARTSRPTRLSTGRAPGWTWTKQYRTVSRG